MTAAKEPKEGVEEAPARTTLHYKQLLINALIKPPDNKHEGFLFRDTTDVPYIIDAIDSAIFLSNEKNPLNLPPKVRRCVALGTTEWDDMLNRGWWFLTKTPLAANTHRELTGAIAAFARDPDRPIHPVYRRVGEDADGNIVIDIGGDTGKVIVCTPKGWTVTDYIKTNVWFQRSAKTLPIPVAGGSIDMLRKHLNIQNDDDFNLAVAWLLASLRPHGPYPNLTITGEAGSAKTTLARCLRNLIDPSLKDVRVWVDNPETIAINATKDWVIAYDNLTTVRATTSDILCNMSTGGTYSGRTLYTNTGETTVSLSHPLILTSVADVVTKPDLMDRALLIEMSPPTGENYLSEDELAAAFETEAPAILGALLDVVCSALAAYPEVGRVKKVRLPRMADFAKWMLAASPALKWEPDYFLRIYEENRRKGTAVALDSNPWTTLLTTILTDYFTNNPEATEYLIEPQMLASALNAKGAINSRGRPFNGQALTNALKVLAGSLRKETGIDWKHAKSNSVRKYFFTHMARAEAATKAAESRAPWFVKTNDAA